MARVEAQDLRIVALVRNNRRKEAFDELYVAHVDRLHKLCLTFFRDPMQAEDALQESWILIWRNLAQYGGRGPALQWAAAIVRNCCRKRLKQPLRLVPTIPAELETLNEDYRGSADDSPDQSNPQWVGVRDLVDRLPEHFRSVVILIYYHNLLVLEATQLLGIPEGTVKTHLHRARKAMLGQLRLRGLDRPELWLETGR